MRDANGLHQAFLLQLEEGIPSFHQLPRVGRVNPVVPGRVVDYHPQYTYRFIVYSLYMDTLWQ